MPATQLSQLVSARTSDQILAQLIQALRGIGFVRQTGAGGEGVGLGTGTLTASGLAKIDASVIVKIAATGEPGAATYQVSTDGGSSYSVAATIPATATVLGTTGATLTFSAGPTGAGDSFVAGDEYRFYLAIPTFAQTAWQQYSWHRRILEIEAEAGSDVDELVAAIAAGGLLDTATGAWLDLLAASCYGETRNAAQYAIGTCVLTDAGLGGPYTIQAGERTAADSSGLVRFTNRTGGTLTAGGTLSLDFQAESPGLAWNLGESGITQLLDPLPGVTITNPSRVSAVAKSRAASPVVGLSWTGSPAGDYDVRVEITTGGALGAAVFRYSLDDGVTWAASGVTAAATYTVGATGLTMTFASGTYQLGDIYTATATISWLSQAGVDQESDDALRVRCQKKWASLAVGTTDTGFEYWALEASPQVTRAYARESATTAGQVELYLAGAAGAVGADVVTAVDNYVQPRVPLTSTCVTDSASALAISLVGTVYVKSGQRAAAQAAAEAALAEYIAALPIGGYKIGSNRIVSRDAIIGAIVSGSAAHPVAGVVDLNLTTPAADVTIAETEVATLSASGLTWTEV